MAGKSFLLCNSSCRLLLKSCRSISKRATAILGIETSCDDTAIAIVSDQGECLAKRWRCDRRETNRIGGVVPSHVAVQHRSVIDRLVDECLDEAHIRAADLTAIAVSTKPGLTLALKVGADKALQMARCYNLTLIPVHHMRAHALTIRMVNRDVAYPFLCLLMSGGHCILSLVRSAIDFRLLVDSQSGSPGEAIDKIARALNLHKMPEFNDCSGGSALEQVASRSTGKISYRVKMPKIDNSKFDFFAIREAFLKEITRLNSNLDLPAFCDSVQRVILEHVECRLRQSIERVDKDGQLPDVNRLLVLSGGVVSNKFFTQSIREIAAEYSFKCLWPTPDLCTDNGEMIAWYGWEILGQGYSGEQFTFPPSSLPRDVVVEARCPIGPRELFFKDF